MSVIDSSLLNRVILVNEQDQPIGTEEKLKAHQLGLLHRAISICVLRPAASGFDLLLQQRAKEKYHSGSLWTNTCCSHPYPGEETLAAAERRLHEEMGIRLPLQPAYHFIYRAALDNHLIEHELDHVFIGMVTASIEIYPRADEVMAYRWINLNTLIKEINQSPDDFTAWLPQVIEIASEWIRNHYL